jgi:DNA-binding Lrp family transcriptional regulator
MVRRFQHRRELAELVVQRAEFLSAEERALLVAVYGDGRTVKEVAALLGVEARRLRRRVARLTRRVVSDRFIFVVRHRESWPAARRRLATACIVQGKSLRIAAAEVRTSLYNARKQMDAVGALLDAVVHGGGRAGPRAGGGEGTGGEVRG